MDVVEPYIPPTKIPRPKFDGKHNSETSFQKVSNTYPTIVILVRRGMSLALVSIKADITSNEINFTNAECSEYNIHNASRSRAFRIITSGRAAFSTSSPT
jgi:hypothetical protein